MIFSIDEWNGVMKLPNVTCGMKLPPLFGSHPENKPATSAASMHDFPDLKELENKVGRKTPEILILWMRNAADSQDVETEHQNCILSDSFATKLSNLKQEMKWMRSADVRILRQLVAVHEGIESMRWLMMEWSTLAGRDSSLTGSLSSSVTVEEGARSLTPCRCSVRRETMEKIHLTYPENLPDTFTQESSGHSPRNDSEHSHQNSCVEMSSQEFSPSTNCLVENDFQESEPQDSEARSLQELKVGAGPNKEVDERLQETKQQSHNSIREADEKMAALLFGYDAQWCWIESQDDVMFL
ncbi:leucine rich adaptor protein 1-like isoform X3 [Syngnathus scovelli]|nr:leucine rich adaptor protein 1-like isoform X3 [Syngnathus scovelli]